MYDFYVNKSGMWPFPIQASPTIPLRSRWIGCHHIEVRTQGLGVLKLVVEMINTEGANQYSMSKCFLWNGCRFNPVIYHQFPSSKCHVREYSPFSCAPQVILLLRLCDIPPNYMRLISPFLHYGSLLYRMGPRWLNCLFCGFTMVELVDITK